MNNSLWRIQRLEGQSWEQAYGADRRFWRLTRAERSRLLAWAKQQEIHYAALSDPPPETAFFIPDGMTPEEATREKIRRDAELYPIETTPYVRVDDIPINELAKLEKWRVPPRRRNELRKYQDTLRRKALADRDGKVEAKDPSKPGEREYWKISPHGPSGANGLNPNSPSPVEPPQSAHIESPSDIKEARTSGSCEWKVSTLFNEFKAVPGQATFRIRDKSLPGTGGIYEIPPDRVNRTSVTTPVGTMDAKEIADHLLSDNVSELPEELREAMVDRYLMLEGVPTESFWKEFEKDSY